MGQVVVVGLDIAKSVFQVHGVDRDGEVVVRRRLRRSRVLPLFANGRALSDRHRGVCHRALLGTRAGRALGHDVRLMAPSSVKSYVKRQKNDVADAEAICEAVARPTMRRFVAVKTAEQQSVMVLHRTRLLLAIGLQRLRIDQRDATFFAVKEDRLPREAACALVVLCEHDCEHPRGVLGVGRILRAQHHALLVVVDLPDERAPGEFEASEVVLPVGIVVGSEVVEGA